MKKLHLVLVLAMVALVAASPAPTKRNVILIVPDGCSSAIWAATRLMTTGPDGSLNVDTMPVHSRARTYSADAMVTDSAASGTTYATGHKTNNGILSMSASTQRGDSLTGEALPTILEMAERAGYATGLVTTTSIQHATPAAFYTHQADRNWYERISHDLPASGVEVLMGGGREYLIPQGTEGIEGARSRRSDDRNILREMEDIGYTVIQNTSGFSTVDPAETDRLFGIFNPGQMQYELDRPDDPAGEPALDSMTAMAINILSRQPKGFFLMVEAGRIDHACHDHDADRALRDAYICDRVAGTALDFATTNNETLVIVVADHGCGGPHLTGRYASNARTRSTTSRPELPRRNADGYFSVSDFIPVELQWIESTGHTGEDVPLFAYGPGSEKLAGDVENTYVNTVMRAHLGLN